MVAQLSREGWAGGPIYYVATRIKFRKGMQRKFIDLVILKTLAPSLRRLLQYGLKVDYSTLKSYYNENRTLPEDLFEDMLILARLDEKSFSVVHLREYWGQSKGGKKSRKGKR